MERARSHQRPGGKLASHVTTLPQVPEPMSEKGLGVILAHHFGKELRRRWQRQPLRVILGLSATVSYLVHLLLLALGWR